MGLQDTITKGLRAGFKAAGDQITKCRYEHIVTTIIDTSTDQASVISKSYFFSAIFKQYSTFERINLPIDDKDVKALVIKEDLPVEPENSGIFYAVENNVSTEYTVKNYERIANAAYLFYLRKKK